MAYEMMGTHEYLDGALIDIREEYISSISSSNHLYKQNVVRDGVSNPCVDFNI